MVYKTEEEAQKYFAEDYRKLVGADFKECYEEFDASSDIDYKRKFEALLRVIDKNCYGFNGKDNSSAKYLNHIAHEASNLEHYSDYYGEKERSVHEP